MHTIFLDFFLSFFHDLEKFPKLLVDTLTTYRHACDTNLFFSPCLIESGFAVAIDFFFLRR